MALSKHLGNEAGHPITVGSETVYAPAVVISDTSGNALNPAAPTIQAGEAHIGETGGRIVNISANFTRPADTTAYASGDLVANSVTAGSVTPMTFTNAARVAAGNFCVLRARISKTTAGVTGAAFRVHLFTTSPTSPTNGDNGAFIPSQIASYLGYLDVAAMQQGTAGAAGTGGMGSGLGNGIAVALGSGRDIYGLLEARGAYTPGNAEVFTTTLEISQN